MREPVRVFGLRVSTSLFRCWACSRLWAACSGRKRSKLGKDRVAILGDGTLEEPLRRGSAIVGKQIEIDTQKFTVIGVVEPVLQFMEQAQLYVPLAFTPAQLDPNARGHQNLDVVGA
jgi:hypothetical protein